MTEQNAGNKYTEASARDKVLSAIRKGKREALEAKLKNMLIELDAAKAVVVAKEDQIKELFENNTDILE